MGSESGELDALDEGLDRLSAGLERALQIVDCFEEG